MGCVSCGGRISAVWKRRLAEQEASREKFRRDMVTHWKLVGGNCPQCGGASQVVTNGMQSLYGCKKCGI